MKYGTFDENGFSIGFYDSGINVIPENAVELTDEQWTALVSGQGTTKWNGVSVVEYTPPARTYPVAPTITSMANAIIYSNHTQTDILGLLAAAVDIADKKAGGTATPEELAQADAIRQLWATIKTIRQREVALTAQYVALGAELTAEDCETIKAALVAAGE